MIMEKYTAFIVIFYVNKNIENGCLYIDHSTGCMVFDTHYRLDQEHSLDTEDIISFCIQTKNKLSEHQKHLYNLLSGKEINRETL